MFKKGNVKGFIIRTSTIVTLIPVLFIGLLVTNIVSQNISEAVKKNNQIIAASIAGRLSQFLDEPHNFLHQIEDILEKNSGASEVDIHQLLQSTLHSYPYFESLEIIDQEGAVHYMAPFKEEFIGIDRSGQEYYRKVRETSKPYWSNTFISMQSGQPTITLALPSTQWIIVGYLNLASIHEITGNISQGFEDSLHISVVDINGTFISHPDVNQVYERNTEKLMREIRQKMNSGETHFVMEINGGKHLYSIAYINPAQWHVIVTQPSNQAYEVLRGIILIIASGALGSAVLAIMFSLISSRELLKPLEVLNLQTRHIASGDYNSLVECNSFNEFNELSYNFNEMVHAIRTRNTELRHMAYFDSLTGLHNRTFILEKLKRILDEYHGSEKKLAVLFLDFDNFKKINDTLGHSFGDELLRQAAIRIMECVPKNGSLARLGGDEFIILLTGILERNDVNGLIGSIGETFSKPFDCFGKKLLISTSIGITLYPEDGTESSVLLKNADTALYAAKDSGKNVHRFFEVSMRENFTRMLRIEDLLRKAIGKEEFMLYYQPQIDVETGKLRGFEALIRWTSPELGFVPPGDFIRIAEERGMIVSIGEWVMRSACRKITEINSLTQDKLIMSVNVSALQLKHEGFLPAFQKLLSEFEFSPEILELEITETIMMDSYEESIRILRKIKELGVKIALDDFGTGYSSLSYLKELPLDTLKIDRSFINDLQKGSTSEKLMESIITMAHKLELEVVAEGVETVEQLEYLISYGCDHVQGYYFSRPMPDEELMHFFENKISFN